MIRRILSIAALLLISFATGWIAHILYAWRAPAPPPEWTTIRVFSGELAKGYPVVARVSASRRFSTGDNSADTFLQNKIEIQAGSMRREFQWADSLSFSAPIADVVDLDNDGAKEFVLASAGAVKVVSFINGSFIHREKLDELFSHGMDLAMVERASGAREFVKVTNATNTTADKTFTATRWVKNLGFVPVPSREE